MDFILELIEVWAELPLLVRFLVALIPLLIAGCCSAAGIHFPFLWAIGGAFLLAVFIPDQICFDVRISQND